MTGYRQFLFTLKGMLAMAFEESGLPLSEISERSGKSEDKLVSIFYGKGNFRINDLLDISRALEMRCSFSFVDTNGSEYHPDNDYFLLYSDCSEKTIEIRKARLRERIDGSSNLATRNQLFLELNRLDYDNCNNPMQRYLVYLKVEAALHELCIDRFEFADLLNVSMHYVEKLEDGAANFSIELLYRLAAITDSEWRISLESWMTEEKTG